MSDENKELEKSYEESLGLLPGPIMHEWYGDDLVAMAKWPDGTITAQSLSANCRIELFRTLDVIANPIEVKALWITCEGDYVDSSHDTTWSGDCWYTDQGPWGCVDEDDVFEEAAD